MANEKSISLENLNTFKTKIKEEIPSITIATGTVTLDGWINVVDEDDKEMMYFPFPCQGIGKNDKIIISPVLSNDGEAGKLQIEAYKRLLNGTAVIESASNEIWLIIYGEQPSIELQLKVLIIK